MQRGRLFPIVAFKTLAIQKAV